MIRTVTALSLLALLAFGFAGCGSSEERDYGGEVSSGPAPTQSNDAKIKEFQDNPNIPADAKQKAIAALQRSGGK